MHATCQRKIGFHIPLQVIDDRSCATDALLEIGIISHFIGEHMPVAWGRLGIGTVRPELSKHSHII